MALSVGVLLSLVASGFCTLVHPLEYMGDRFNGTSTRLILSACKLCGDGVEFISTQMRSSRGLTPSVLCCRQVERKSVWKRCANGC